MKVRAFTVEDAPFVNSMLKEEYGEAYPYLLSACPPQKDILLVAEYGNEIAAFAKAERIFQDVFEFGSLIIHPAYRGNGLAELMVRKRLECVAIHGDHVTIITELVCYRADKASQQNCLVHGKFKQFGIQPAKHPCIHPDLLGTQPESLTFAVREDSKSFFQGRRIYLPGRWREIASLLCKEVHSGHLLHSTMPAPFYHSPRIADDVQGAEFIDIPANWQESAAFMERYFAQGYRFSALLPRMGRRAYEVFDLVRLYRSQSPINWSLIHVTDDLAPLKAFMKEEERSPVKTQ
jgi:GNAT superfamily N-acetyltransferase